ncbi:MAG: type IV secretion system protein [Candidatus Kaiserbacteria bacterium]|nr:type IV secretion system protein [Candidatus Kaiserbacteria bacterium]
MFAKINNLITKKTFLGLLLCVIVFLTPVSATYIPSNDATVQKIEGEVLVAFAKDPNDKGLGYLTDSELLGMAKGSYYEMWKSLGLWIGNTILAVASMFTYVGGTFLDMSLKITVFKMGDLINGGVGNAINNTWKIIRDICNLAFIFGFVYIGIRTIIDPESASTKRFLSKIIIGALLINFSLFFVKFIVDFSNFTAYHIYNAMVSGEGSLSATVANMLGIVSLFKAPDPAQFAQLTNGASFWFFVFGAILLLIVAFVFFAAAIHLITRFVALVLIMVGSPILFAATVFPQTEHYASDMWKKLISYAFFAPVFLLLILISLTLVQGLGTAIAPNGSSFVTALKQGSNSSVGQTGSMGIILNFAVIIFFFIQSLLLAQKMGVAGGDAAVSMGNKIRGNVQSAIGRNTIGAASHKIREKYEEFDAKTKDSKNWNRLKTVGKIATLGAVDDRTIRQTLEAGEHAKFGGSYSYEDDKKYSDSRTARQAKTLETEKIKATIEAGASTPVGDPARIPMERAIAGASSEQILSLLADPEYKHGTPKYNELVGHLSSSQFENVMKAKPEDFDDAKKAQVSASRASFIKTKHGVVGGAVGATPGTIGKADASDLDAMDFDTVVQHAGHISAKQIDDMKGLTPTAKKTLKDARNNALIKEFKPAGVSTPASATSLFNRITNDTERSKLPPEILTDTKAAQHLNANVLTKILDNDSIDSVKRNTIKTNVQMIHGNNAFNNFFTTPAGSRY